MSIRTLMALHKIAKRPTAVLEANRQYAAENKKSNNADIEAARMYAAAQRYEAELQKQQQAATQSPTTPPPTKEPPKITAKIPANKPQVTKSQANTTAVAPKAPAAAKGKSVAGSTGYVAPQDDINEAPWGDPYDDAARSAYEHPVTPRYVGKNNEWQEEGVDANGVPKLRYVGKNRPLPAAARRERAEQGRRQELSGYGDPNPDETNWLEDTYTWGSNVPKNIRLWWNKKGGVVGGARNVFEPGTLSNFDWRDMWLLRSPKTVREQRGARELEKKTENDY